jgi:hypothetical protein
VCKTPYEALTTNHQPRITNHGLPSTNHQPPTTNHPTAATDTRAGDVEQPWTLDKVGLSSNPMGALAESVVEGAGGCCADETSSVDGEQVTMTF